MKQQLVFVTRQSPDWQTLAEDFAQGHYIDPSRFRPAQSIPGFPPNVVELIDSWNTHLSLDFFSCRSQLQKIADDTIAQIAGAQRFSYDQINSTSLENENYVVFFHDDDDWFVPNMSTILSQISAVNYDICVFPLIRLWTDTFTFVRHGQNAQMVVGRKQDFHFRYQSNNYGLNGRICDGATLLAMKDHVLASDYANKRAFRDVYLDQIIGVTAKTPCAASMLPSVFCEPNKARDHIRCYVDALGTLTIPTELGWVGDRVKCLIELFSRVLSKP